MEATLNDAYNWYFDGKIKASYFDNRRKNRTGFTFDITALQRFILFHLQSEIVYTTAYVRGDDGKLQSKRLAKLLTKVHEYCDAVRDLEYMEQWVREKHGGNEDNLFEMTCSRQLERMILEDYWPQIVGQLPDAGDERKPKLPGSKLSRKRNLEQLKWPWRVTMGLATGGAIIAPVAIILFVNAKYINLITTCVAVAAMPLALTLLPLIFSRWVRAEDARCCYHNRRICISVNRVRRHKDKGVILRD